MDRRRRLQRRVPFNCGPVLFLTSLLWASAGQTQVGIETPLPPPMEPVPCPPPEVSQPVVSYRVSPMCEVTAVETVGEYRFGTHELQQAVRSFARSDTERRLEGGQMVYVRRIEIPLHRALEPPARLVCHADMMRTRVLDAEIVRPGTGERGPVTEPVRVEGGRLPDLGLFTYTRDVTVPGTGCLQEVP